MPKEIKPDRLRYLSQKWIDQSITPQERAELDAWYHDHFDDYLVEDMDEQELAAWQERAYIKLQNQKSKGRIRQYWYRRSLVAASITLLGFAVYWFALRQFTAVEIINPGRQQAIVYDDQGGTVALDAVSEGQLIDIGGAQWEKSADGTLLYVGTGADGSARSTTIETPKGGEITVRLPDGSLAFINADSKLQLSPNFGAEKREIHLSGEAYFEVRHDPSLPFLVQTTSSEIRVLGTHFNVKAYPEESTVKTTLAEGSVALFHKDKGSKTVLRPGQQGIVSRAGTNVLEVDLAQTLAWKNGEFVFDQENLALVMQQLARWYDISYEFETEALKKLRLWGILDRHASFEDMLQMLNESNVAHFEQKGRRVYVKN